MITLYIVRHGQTVDNLENRIQGHSDSPLTALGVRQAEAIAKRLASEHFDAIYSSDLGRAVATAEIIVSKQPSTRSEASDSILSLSKGAVTGIRTTPLLRELNLGVAQGLTAREFAEKWPEEYRQWSSNSVTHRPPGAESIESLTERCREFVQQVLRDHKDGEKLAVVGHSGSQRGLVCAALDLPVRYYRSISVANAALSIVEAGDRPSLRLYNDTCHLHGVEVTVSDVDAG
jgi:broad specificity phosphatase PhoE